LNEILKWFESDILQRQQASTHSQNSQPV